MMASDVYTETIRPPNMKRVFLSIVIGLALLAVITWGIHSVKKHSEAQQIHKCMEDKGPVHVFQMKSRPGDHWYCVQLDDGRWGLSLVRHTKSGARQEITSFVPDGKGSGTWTRLWEYISSKDVIDVTHLILGG